LIEHKTEFAELRNNKIIITIRVFFSLKIGDKIWSYLYVDDLLTSRRLFVKLKYQSITIILSDGINYSVRDLFCDVNIYYIVNVLLSNKCYFWFFWLLCVGRVAVTYFF